MTFRNPFESSGAIALRPYQLEAVDAIQIAHTLGTQRPAVVLPTGTGKTTVIAELVDRHVKQTNTRAVVLAHRTEIVDQIYDRILRHSGISFGVGIVAAQRNEVRAMAVAGMVQTLRNPNRWSQLENVGLVVVDECHHASATSYQDILSGLGAFDRTKAVGFTATLSRGDDKNLSDTWDDVVYTRSIRWAIEKGYLCPVKGKSVVMKGLDLSKVKKTAGDYQDNALGEVMAARAEDIAKTWATHASDRQTAVFVPSVASAYEIAEKMADHGAKAAVVVGETPTEERNRIYSEFANGDLNVIVSVAVLTEGWDMPSVDCVLMARPTQLAHVYVQAAGRGLRPHPGKDHCLILDVVGVSRIHSLVSLVDLEESTSYQRVTPEGEDVEDEDEEELDTEEENVQFHRGVDELEEVDLFRMSDKIWLRTRKGVRFIPTKNYVIFIWPTSDDELFFVGTMPTKSGRSGGFVGAGWREDVPITEATAFTMDDARSMAESLAAQHGATYSSKNASWRNRGKPSEAQVRYARGVGVYAPETYSKSDLSDQIEIAVASHYLDR